MIKNAAENINKTVSAKYGIAPENIDKKSLDLKDGKYFQEVYDFMRLKKKNQNNEMRVDKYNQRIDRRKKTLRSPLNIGEKVLVLAERLKKKYVPGKFFKSSTVFHFSIEIGFLQFIKRLNYTILLIYIN